MEFSLNSTGRVFIQESPCSVFEYADAQGLQVAGINESFGDVTNITIASDIEMNDYIVAAQITGAESAPTTTITGYIPANGRSQLRELARKKCAFNMVIKYGECTNPTDATQFDYAILFENVRITGYSTTDLTSRSPDNRSLIDATFNVSIKQIHYLYKSDFTEHFNTVAIAGSALAVTSYNDSNCGGNDCEDQCVIMAIQYKNSTFKFLYKDRNDEWTSTNIISGVTKYSSTKNFVYTNGTTIYVGITLASPMTFKLYSAPFPQLGETIQFVEIYTASANSSPSVYSYGNNIYFALSNGSATQLATLNTSNNQINTYGTFGAAISTIFGFNDIVYIGTESGSLYRLYNKKLTYVSAPSEYASFTGVSITSETSFKVVAIYSNSSEILCTSDGGYTWYNVGSVSEPVVCRTINRTTPFHTLFLAKNSNNIYETFDGGLTYILNTDLRTSVIPTDTAFCGESIYISTETADNNYGYIYENKK